MDNNSRPEGIAIEPAVVQGKNLITPPDLAEEVAQVVNMNTENAEPAAVSGGKRPRGRPKKVRVEDGRARVSGDNANAEPAVSSPALGGKRRRGRPKKVRVEDGVVTLALGGDSVGSANIPIATGTREGALSVIGNGSLVEITENKDLSKTNTLQSDTRISSIDKLAENLMKSGAMLTEGCLFDPDTDPPVVSVLVPAESVKRKRGRPRKGTTPSKQPTLGPKRKPGRPRIHPIKENTGEKRPPGRPRIHPIKENTGEKRTPGRPRIHPIKENTGEKRSPGRPRKRPIDSSQPSEAKKIKEDSEGETSDVKEEENSSSIKSGGRMKISKEIVDKILGEKVASEQEGAENLSCDSAKPTSESQVTSSEKHKVDVSLLTSETEVSNDTTPIKRQRGRPRKTPISNNTTPKPLPSKSLDETSVRKPGRPRKNPVSPSKEVVSTSESPVMSEAPIVSADKTGRRKGVKNNLDDGGEKGVMGKLQVSFSDSESEGSEPMELSRKAISALTERVDPLSTTIPPRNDSPLLVDNKFEESFDEESDN